MRILWVSHSAAVGGAELALVEGVAALAEYGHQVHVVLPSEGPLAGRLSEATSTHVVPMVKWASRTPASVVARARHLGHAFFSGSRHLARLASQLEVDAVLSNTITLATGALAARRARKPHVWFLHEYGGLDHGLRFYLGEGPTLRLVASLSAVVLVSSAALENHFRPRLGSREIHRASYAVCVKRSGTAPVPGSSSGLDLIVVGQRAASKGQLDAVLAMADLRSRGLNVRLRLVGGYEPAYDEVLRRTVSHLGLQAVVEFMDFTENRFLLMEQSDVVLVCSPHEAFGRVTVEAMKLGRVVVGTDCGATSELVRPGENGLLYRAGDHRDLATRVTRLYQDRGRCAGLAARAQAYAEETFSLSKYGRALEQALTAALAGKRPGVADGRH